MLRDREVISHSLKVELQRTTLLMCRQKVVVVRQALPPMCRQKVVMVVLQATPLTC